MRENQALYQKIDQWIDAHRDEVIRDICRLVSIRSVSTPGEGGAPYGLGCRRALEEMLRLGAEYGFKTQNFEDRCGALWLEDAAGRETIGFWGHLDVVPEGSGWQHDPYAPVLEQGYLIGRGCQDNKGPTVGILHLLRGFGELGIPLRHALKLFVGCDEERGMSDLSYYTARYPCPEMSIVADSGFPVCYGEKGILEGEIIAPAPGAPLLSLSGGTASNMVPDRAEARLARTPEALRWSQSLPEGLELSEEADALVVRAFGISRHSAAPEGAVNAIQKLTEALAQSGLFEGDGRRGLSLLAQICGETSGETLGIAYRDEVSGPLTCVGSLLRSGEEGCPRLNLNIRYPITADPAAMQQAMAERAQEYGCSFWLERDSAPNYFPKEHPAVERLTALFNRETGLDQAPYVMGGGTYARKLPQAFAYGPGGIPVPPAPEGLFPPGHGGAHEPDEGLCLEGLFKALKIYARALIELDSLKLAQE